MTVSHFIVAFEAIAPEGVDVTHKLRSAVLIQTVIFVLACASAATADVLYGADGAAGNPSNLYILDPATGAITSTVGPIGFAVTGLAIDPLTGILYGSTGQASPTSPGFLITINTTTGAGTIVGDLRGNSETAADLAFTSDGSLYGWLEGFSDDLVLINEITGAAAIVGDSGLDTFGAGLAADPGVGDTFYLAGEGDDGCIHAIDRLTGSVIVSCLVTLNGTTGNPISAMAFDSSGTLFGIRLDRGTGFAELITINLATGSITVVGPTVDRLDAIEFAANERVPEPAGILLIGSGLAACGWRRLRRLPHFIPSLALTQKLRFSACSARQE